MVIVPLKRETLNEGKVTVPAYSEKRYEGMTAVPRYRGLL